MNEHKPTGTIGHVAPPGFGPMTDALAASPIAPAAQPSIRAALEAPGCERLRDFYAVGPVQRAAVEAFVSAIGGVDLPDGAKR